VVPGFSGAKLITNPRLQFVLESLAGHTETLKPLHDFFRAIYLYVLTPLVTRYLRYEAGDSSLALAIRNSVALGV
jgi:hypothetical protein